MSKVIYKEMKLPILEWCTIVRVPFRVSEKYGAVVHASVLKNCEQVASDFIVRANVPIRGMELKFLRKSFGYSLEKLAKELGVTAPTIFNWEKVLTERVEAIVEIAIRAWAAEKLGTKIPGTLSNLLSAQETPEETELKYA